MAEDRGRESVELLVSPRDSVVRTSAEPYRVAFAKCGRARRADCSMIDVFPGDGCVKGETTWIR